jgi:hypothetical protein
LDCAQARSFFLTHGLTRPLLGTAAQVMSWSREWSSVARVGEHPRKHTTAFGTDEAKLAPTFHEGGDGAKHPFVRFADGARLRLPPGSEGVLASGSGSGITVVAVVRARANKDGGHEPALLSCVIFD